MALLVSSTIISSTSVAGEVEDFRFAEKLLADSLFSAAGDEFIRFAEKYPRSTLVSDAYFKGGEAYMQAGKAQSALDAFERFVELAPEDKRTCKAFYYRGKILSALKRYSEAAKEFLKVPDRDITSPIVDVSLLEAGKALLSSGNFEESSKVLRRLIYERKRSDVTPKAIYIYSTVLYNLGRKLEAREVLEGLTEQYPKAPITAFALLELGEEAKNSLNFDKAESYYRLILDRFKEHAIRERASYQLIGVKKAKMDKEGFIELSASFLKDFPDTKLKAKVALEAADEAFKLGLYDRVLEFVKSLRAKDISYQDSTGHYALIMANSYHRLGKDREALKEIARIKHTPGAMDEVMRNAIALKADIEASREEYQEALRLYNMALLFDPSAEEKISILEKLANISASYAGDTLSALLYWDMVAGIDPAGESGENAIWRASNLKESLGFLEEAELGYRSIVEKFPEGRHYRAAREKLERLKVAPRTKVEPLRDLASLIARSGSEAQDFLEAGLILLNGAGDAEGALSYLDKAYRSISVDSLKARAGYHLALARYELSKTAKDAKRKSTLERKALSLWREIARSFVGTRWGELSHRRYIEGKSPYWDSEEAVARYDEFLKYYGSGPGRWWALNGKLSIYYEGALKGKDSYADSALVVSRKLVGMKGVPREFRREALLKLGYLLRRQGDHAGAVDVMKEFLSKFPEDTRKRFILYDLGEELMKTKNYGSARLMFERCVDAGSGRDLVEKCMLRIGDCFYYERMFKKAVEAYRYFLETFPGSKIADEVIFRLALASEMAGDRDRSLSLLRNLYSRDSLGGALRVRVLKRYANALIKRGEHDKALNVIDQLVKLKSDSQSLMLLAEASLGAKRYQDALKSFTKALKFPGVDSCLALSGRAQALAGLKRFKEMDSALFAFMNRCPGSHKEAELLLKIGISEMEAGRIDSARSRFEVLSKTFPKKDEAAQSLYYSAICDMKQGGYKEAIDKLHRFLKISPDSPLTAKAYLKIASANYMMKNQNLAAKYYSYAAESARDPDIKYMAMSNLGRVLQELEEWDKAADVWKDLADEYPGRADVVETLFNLGFCYGRAQKFELAYEVYSRIPDLTFDEEQEGRAHYWAGESLKNMKKLKDAAMEFLRVPYLKTGGMWGVTSKLEAASCYEMLGEYDEAGKICNEVITKFGKGSNWGMLAEKILERIEEKKGAEVGAGEQKNRGR